MSYKTYEEIFEDAKQASYMKDARNIKTGDVLVFYNELSIVIETRKISNTQTLIKLCSREFITLSPWKFRVLR